MQPRLYSAADDPIRVHGGDPQDLIEVGVDGDRIIVSVGDRSAVLDRPGTEDLIAVLHEQLARAAG